MKTSKSNTGRRRRKRATSGTVVPRGKDTVLNHTPSEPDTEATFVYDKEERDYEEKLSIIDDVIDPGNDDHRL